MAMGSGSRQRGPVEKTLLNCYIFETPRPVKPRNEYYSQVAWKAEVQARLNLRAGTVQGFAIQVVVRAESQHL